MNLTGRVYYVAKTSKKKKGPHPGILEFFSNIPIFQSKSKCVASICITEETQQWQQNVFDPMQSNKPES